MKKTNFKNFLLNEEDYQIPTIDFDNPNNSLPLNQPKILFIPPTPIGISQPPGNSNPYFNLGYFDLYDNKQLKSELLKLSKKNKAKIEGIFRNKIQVSFNFNKSEKNPIDTKLKDKAYDFKEKLKDILMKYDLLIFSVDLSISKSYVTYKIINSNRFY